MILFFVNAEKIIQLLQLNDVSRLVLTTWYNQFMYMYQN